MWEYLVNAISRATGFSKTESRGTLILILIMFAALAGTRLRINYLKNQSTILVDSTAYAWVQQVQTSYELKEIVEEEKFDKSVYLPAKLEDRKQPKKEFSKPSTNTSEPKYEKITIADLNKASAEELQKVRGIGPAFSERITKYRDLLGGFADTTQLHDVYGLQQETITELFKHFNIQSGVQPIEINSDSIKVLASHPYISYDLARTIINYRKLHGDIQSVEDLKEIKAIDERTFLRLKPYLKSGDAKNP